MDKRWWLSRRCFAPFSVKQRNLPKKSNAWESRDPKNLKMEVYIDGKLHETAELPTDYITRRNELTWKYQLTDSKHHVKLKMLDPSPEYLCRITELIWYSSKPQEKITIGSFGTIKKKSE